MNQIAIGDPSGYNVLEGPSISSPYYHAIPVFANSSEDIVDEKIEITLKGTPAQISAALADLEKRVYHDHLYGQKAYPNPQYLRFQMAPGDPYYYAEISDLSLVPHPNSYRTHTRGSLALELHYHRRNYFDGPQIEVPLSGRFGEDLTGGVPLYNHTDYHSLHDSTALIKPGVLTSPLPAPLRIELENTTATDAIKDIYVGMFHHQTLDDGSPFFHNAPDISGGSLLMDLNAINETYRSFSWSAVEWTALATITLTLDLVDGLAGHSYRPFIHLFHAHAYSDLFLCCKLQRGSSVVYAGESVYADPAYNYIFLPPIDIPPNQLLREGYPHSMDFVQYGCKSTADVYSLDIDQVQFFPLDYAANFLGFFSMSQGDTLVDDSFRGLSNVRYSAAGSEMVAHIRQGGPLLARSGAYNRLFLLLGNTGNTVDIMRTATLRVYQRERRRIL
jgi:hypothetical protein